MIAPGIDLSHTPGIYYAIAYWLGCSFFIWHNPKRLTGWKLGVAHVLFFVAIAAFMVATDGVSRVWFLPCVSFYVFLMLVFIKTCCDINWTKAGYFCARAFIMGEFAASLEWQLLDFMNPMDLSALFGNALDNAIESVSKIQDPEKRLIHVSVVRQKNFLRIRVENCYEGDIHFRHGVPVTTKDESYHGFGLKSMKQTVEKYNGSLTIHAKDGWFELRILFPITAAPEPAAQE